MIRLFKVFIPVSVLGLLTTESALLFGCYVFACYWELGIEADPYLIEHNGLARSATVAMAFVVGAYLGDLYTHIRVRSNVALISRMMSILGGALICEALIGFINPDWALPKSVILTGTVTGVIALSGWRMLYSRAMMASIASQKILFVGAAPLVFRICGQLRDRPELGIRSVGYLAEEYVETDLLPCIGRPDDITAAVSRTKPDRVVIAMTDRRGKLPMNHLLDLRFSGTRIEEAASLYEEAFGRVCIDEIRPSHLIFTTQLGPRHWTLRAQAIYSFLIAAVALLITAPILVLAAMLVKLTSKGPILYRQTRVGRHGETFELYKLRSMYQDAEARTGPVWATANDPRITPLGRVFRKSRLDELPQLVNVLKGDMTIVGPRPERPEFVCELAAAIPYYPHRHCVKPGITGWAQINHQYGDTIVHAKTKLEYDLYYIKNLSPSLDAYIMFQTAKTMLLSRGAQ